MRLPSSSLFFFFFNDTATTEIYTLSLHDALPISEPASRIASICACSAFGDSSSSSMPRPRAPRKNGGVLSPPKSRTPTVAGRPASHRRSEEHTSELQSHLDLVCPLLL